MSKITPLFFLAVLLPFLVADPARAQSSRAEAFYVKVGQGVSDYAGSGGGGEGFADFFDSRKFTDDDRQYAFVFEAGYRFSPSLSLGLGYQLGTYYFIDIGPIDQGSKTFQTIQMFGRYKLGARDWTVSPYADLGVNVTPGLEGTGFGPSIGGGLDITVDNQLSLFIESRLNLLFPDEALEGLGGGIPFDVLTVFPAIGAEFTLR